MKEFKNSHYLRSYVMLTSYHSSHYGVWPCSVAVITAEIAIEIDNKPFAFCNSFCL